MNFAAGRPPSTRPNKIINGDFRISQRYVGDTILPGSGVIYDHWGYSATVANRINFTAVNSISSNPLSSYLYLQNIAAVTNPGAAEAWFLYQKVEGYDCTDLKWSSVAAQPITVSFYAMSRQSGTFGGAIRNDYNLGYRSYPFSFTLVANIWTKITVTIPGDVAGVWLGAESAFLVLIIGLGIGANTQGVANQWQAGNFYAPVGSYNFMSVPGAEMYITAFKIETGGNATPFEIENIETSLIKCQRFYCKTFDRAIRPGVNQGQMGCLAHPPVFTAAAGGYLYPWRFPVTMHHSPTITVYSPNTVGLGWMDQASIDLASAVGNTASGGTLIYTTGGGTVGRNAVCHATAEAEI